MGNESSQLQREAAEARLQELQRGGRVIGPPMSPTPPSSPGEQRDTRKPRGLAADNDDAQDSDANPSKSTKKKKKKKRRRRDSLGDDDATAAVMADDPHAPAPANESPKKSKAKKKSKSKETNGVQSPDAQHLLVSHAVGGSPPSAQQSDANGIAGHAPTLDTESLEQEHMPVSSVEDIEPSQLKTELDIDKRDVPDHELPFRIAADSIVDGDHPQQKSPFMHKREMSIVDTRSEAQSDDEAPLPDLQSSQIKTEPPSSESESDLASPSVARLDRLERSRSRSISRPPLIKPAIESVSISTCTPAYPNSSAKLFVLSFICVIKPSRQADRLQARTRASQLDSKTPDPPREALQTRTANMTFN